MPLIIFEGPDAVGKSTIMESVAEWLRIRFEHPIVVHNPGATKVGQQVRTMTKDPDAKIYPITEQTLMFADYAAQVEEIIIPNRDRWILMDRHNYISGLVYGKANGLSTEYITNMYSLLKQKIDVCFFFLCDPKVIEERRKKDVMRRACRFEARGEEFLTKVVKGYAEVAASPLSEWIDKKVVLDAAKKPPELVQEIVDVLGALQ
ncbi:MAG: hypothetical protein Q8K86_05725 [Candidatus Nanopelagicaceae bacterium]|nr:hypothetical protein [Candidatus Nanopelagicaceae bacterium]